MEKAALTGLMPAMITRFQGDGSLDCQGIAQNVEFLIASGVSGIVVNGSTGEAIALTREERMQAVALSAEEKQCITQALQQTGLV
ncbi:MAG: hypothetical protein D6736_02180 [Nitrospinota bacterium]|nr:MAG: hypothetical protein D6736_02180 [Nitrospinota bacterium]